MLWVLLILGGVWFLSSRIRAAAEKARNEQR